MHPTSVSHFGPCAGPESIANEVTALGVVGLAVHRPARDETIAIVLDGAARALAIVVVAGTTTPDAVVEVVEFVTESACGEARAAGLVVASVRASRRSREHEVVRDDADRWFEMSAIADDAGLDLIEWFVIDHQIRCPRDQLGAPPRWPKPPPPGAARWG